MRHESEYLQAKRTAIQGQDKSEAGDCAWLYVRIYCQMAEADDVLLELVAPLMERLLKEGLIRRSFFIRYFEGGHHLRVRFYGQKAVLFDSVRVIVHQSISEYFARQGQVVHTPLVWEPRVVDDLVSQTQRHTETQRPVPSYEYDRYEPEIERYGGQEGLYISEQHFADSSAIALRVLIQERNGAGSRRNAALLLLHTLAESFRLDNEQKASSFEQQYLYRASVAWRTPPSREVLAQEYERHRIKMQLLLPLVPQSPVHQSYAVWLPLVEQWRIEVSQTYRALMRLQEQNVLLTPPIVIMSSYIHMLCNRLGLFLREEAYLCYLLYRHYAQQQIENAIDVSTPLGLL